MQKNELVAAVGNATQLIAKEEENAKLLALLHNLGETPKAKQKLILKTTDNLHILQLESILYCESDSNYTHFYLTNGKRITIARLLKVYDEMLSTSGFYRVHKSYLVNLSKIERLHKGDKIVLTDGNLVPVSHRKKDKLMELIHCL